MREMFSLLRAFMVAGGQGGIAPASGIGFRLQTGLKFRCLASRMMLGSGVSRGDEV